MDRFSDLGRFSEPAHPLFCGGPRSDLCFCIAVLGNRKLNLIEIQVEKFFKTLLLQRWKNGPIGGFYYPMTTSAQNHKSGRAGPPLPGTDYLLNVMPQ